VSAGKSLRFFSAMNDEATHYKSTHLTNCVALTFLQFFGKHVPICEQQEDQKKSVKFTSPLLSM